MELVCATHHLVYRDGDTWIKRPRESSDRARAELARDAAVHRALGRPVTTAADGSFSLPHLGTPLSQEHPAPSLDELATALTAAHRAPVRPEVLLTVDDWRRETRTKVEIRLRGHPATRAWCHRALDALGPPPHTPAPGLAITDPHFGNWCRDHDGQLQPLDFETACWADLALPIACLRHYADTTGQPLDDRHSPVDDPTRWYFTVKAVSAVSWLALAHADQIPDRMQLLERSRYWAGAP